jgi:hypothetical protein
VDGDAADVAAAIKLAPVVAHVADVATKFRGAAK